MIRKTITVTYNDLEIIVDGNKITIDIGEKSIASNQNPDKVYTVTKTNISPSSISCDKTSIDALMWATQNDKAVLQAKFPNGVYSFGNNWYYATSTGERDQWNLEGLLPTLYTGYVRFFGIEVMTSSPVIIFYDKALDAPITMPFGNYILIGLSQSEPNTAWSRTIFQLSHEMVHYAYFSRKPYVDQNNFGTIEMSKWNEEIIAEAFSLYMLDYLANNWSDCTRRFGSRSATFNNAIAKYLADEYARAETQTLKSNENPMTPQEFLALSNAAGNRYNHIAERNYLYDLLKSTDLEAYSELLNMYSYYNKAYSYIDYLSWARNAYNGDFIEKASAIQPKIRE